MFRGSRSMNGRVWNERQALTEGLHCKCSVGLAFSREGITIPILQMWILRPMETTRQGSIVSNRACLWAQIYLNLGSSHQADWKHRTHHFPPRLHTTHGFWQWWDPQRPEQDSESGEFFGLRLGDGRRKSLIWAPHPGPAPYYSTSPSPSPCSLFQPPPGLPAFILAHLNPSFTQ